MNNDGTYILFQVTEDGKPHIIKTPEGKWRRKRGTSGQEWLWDSPNENSLYKK